MPFEQKRGGSEGVIYANIQENHLLAEGTAGAKALGQNELASESELVREEWQQSASRSCRAL